VTLRICRTVRSGHGSPRQNSRNHQERGVLAFFVVVILALIGVGALTFEQYNHMYGNIRLQMNIDAAVRVAVEHGELTSMESAMVQYLDNKWAPSQFPVSSTGHWFTDLEITVDGMPLSDFLTVATTMNGLESFGVTLRVEKKVLWRLLPNAPAALQHVVTNSFRANFTRDFVRLAIGQTHTCGLTAGREVWCWGDNQLGQLGPAAAGAMESALPI